MAGREIIFENSQPYHILTRAVDKKRNFTSDKDCFRFIFQMYAASIGKPALNIQWKAVENFVETLFGGQEIKSPLILVENKPLVSTLSFTLVGDHYHFLLVQNTENGIPRYMQKLNTGFAKYFNAKNERKGVLFESRYKVVPIEDEAQLEAIIRYINITNPLDVYQPGWRKDGLKNKKAALDFLNEYKFSSFPDLFGKRGSLLTASNNILEKFLGTDIIKNRKANFEWIEAYLDGATAPLPSVCLEE